MILRRKHAVSRPLSVTFTKLNQIIRGWINYFRIGSMKNFLKEEFDPWYRHKIRVIIIKQWKKPKRIFINLQILNKKFKNNFDGKSICKVAYSRLGWYRKCGGNVANYILSSEVLSLPNKKENRPGLVIPLNYYLSK